MSWHTEALVEYLAGAAGTGPEDTLERLADLLDDLEELLLYAWRRHLAATVARLSDSAGAEELATATALTVGFADLVSYTRLSQRLEQRELGVLVQRFEGLASDVVTAGGGRVVKTVGDEVLFTADAPAAAALIALDAVGADGRRRRRPRRAGRASRTARCCAASATSTGRPSTSPAGSRPWRSPAPSSPTPATGEILAETARPRARAAARPPGARVRADGDPARRRAGPQPRLLDLDVT